MAEYTQAGEQMVPRKADRQLLAQMPLFKSLPEADLRRLFAEIRILELPAESVLFRERDAGDRFYVVLEGQLEIYQAMGTDEERLLAVRGGGEFIGELGLLNPDGRRTASVRSRGPARLGEMTRTGFDRIIQRRPSLAYEMARELSARMTESMAKTINVLQEKNLQLTQAYEELKAAQAQIIEKEKLERELQVAHEIQMSILPSSLPELAGYEFGAQMVPARAVGGDFYDLIPLGPDRVGVIVGDVTGKGVPAAIFMAQIHSLLHVAADLCCTPREVLERVNSQILNIGGTSLFATVLYGVLDSRSGEFAYARAGHELPILGLSGGQVTLASWEVGQPLGFLPEPAIDEQTMIIPPGGTLLLYSDGITDGRDPQGMEFGMERLQQGLSNLVGMPAQSLVDRLWKSLEAHRDNGEQFDDATLVAIRSTNG